jgi:predicted Rossmann-fold nucleotide-binding protein
VVAWVDHAITEGFIRPVHRDLFIVEAEPEALVTRLLTHTPPPGILKLESWRA